jgi:hypothetical protein
MTDRVRSRSGSDCPEVDVVRRVKVMQVEAIDLTFSIQGQSLRSE